LVDADHVTFRGRAHFFASAALAMRHVLVDRARRKRRPKHGGGRQRVELESGPAIDAPDGLDILALDEALSRLAEQSPRRAKVVELRYFAGLGNREIAELLGVSDATVERDWQFAKAWLHRELAGDEHG
jgi:RNA polymerase sigma factor (TIGR02999 family)